MSYETKLLTTSEEDINYAAELILGGELVGMPTETVYGLAADAENVSAVEKIFKAKGRPGDNPLIVHVAEVSQIEEYAKNVPKIAYELAERFCPGPLTMVLPKRDRVPNITSGGLDTVGIRIPYHAAARRLIKASGKAIAAPSANLSGSPSPTTAAHVMDDMSGRIPAVIDGGSCPVGVESTVISFENGVIRVLRPGFVSAEELAEFGEVVADRHITEAAGAGETVRSPGMKYRHYSPKARVTVVRGSEERFADFVNANAAENVYAMPFEALGGLSVPALPYGKTSEEQAARLFAVLRELDERGAERVYAECPEQTGVGLAVYNRLLRAAGFEVIDL
ncbi:MAG: L-threonylcarbamoyladenylate synthase [Ruminococcus sp.]|nr:L-threonylcarbamoyladenylate synthase [Ruminococcus sp.]MCM1381875.1 L-threonylcarbamoyladenylate synthase [Muribaculaceae bacterium]MCM1479219.1 L-threonylcarbamoyladenylate synthase [Muribaculaceae bacterium]